VERLRGPDAPDGRQASIGYVPSANVFNCGVTREHGGSSVVRFFDAGVLSIRQRGELGVTCGELVHLRHVSIQMYAGCICADAPPAARHSRAPDSSPPRRQCSP
jgi:hypothetical protein